CVRKSTYSGHSSPMAFDLW
nr:immunoglobulin heavy chain junction region [Macaca mulatta]MOV47746.1 immunoglobulin heavy chain junction region [Macaca mulatta]MOV47767.1 immunoglobulin heavy chain junction region [Macaca mulatta]MOV47906.1 immunoglobulin heavy chain junction region [Macaca mulatta]MOV48331.1 immunoglobulin heavy chain junction region [Macaca mulatta]